MAAIRTHAGDRILDVGCGSGAYVLDLADDYRIVGVDHQIFPAWRERPQRFAVLDAQHLDGIRTDAFDTVLLFELLEHLDDPMAVLRQAARICRKNVILTVPNTTLTAGQDGSRLIYYHWIDRTHVQFFDRGSLERAIDAAGLELDTMDAINAVNLAPLVTEAFGLGPLSRRWLLRRQRTSYHMTLLAVARPRAH
jgi:ubiquinone/menaquinone biosynthesis C-methylase UbiE